MTLPLDRAREIAQKVNDGYARLKDKDGSTLAEWALASENWKDRAVSFVTAGYAEALARGTGGHCRRFTEEDAERFTRRATKSFEEDVADAVNADRAKYGRVAVPDVEAVKREAHEQGRAEGMKAHEAAVEATQAAALKQAANTGAREAWDAAMWFHVNYPGLLRVASWEAERDRRYPASSPVPSVTPRCALCNADISGEDAVFLRHKANGEADAHLNRDDCIKALATRLGEQGR